MKQPLSTLQDWLLLREEDIVVGWSPIVESYDYSFIPTMGIIRQDLMFSLIPIMLMQSEYSPLLMKYWFPM
ncbi:hypothetical protein F7725_002409 [Dissostichus mawsoni]|uniref:Uncharacterized protein n=1 Tax=Dissostichus mawsoni TaxID=36200 RepID=A0A7J5Y2I7_DISMA|nr:hypothetical protein F7725_002409 [Dissostichus mawsoni]